jgi:hypothetical protein
MVKRLISLIFLYLVTVCTSKHQFIDDTEAARLPSFKAINATEIVEFVTSFNQGLQVFYNLTHYKICNSNDDSIIGDIKVIITIIQNAGPQPDWIDVIMQMSSKVTDIIHNVWEVRKACYALVGQDAPAQYKKIENYLEDPDFIKKVAIHSLDQMNTIRDKIVNVYNGRSQAGELGYALGDLINFLVFFGLD